MAVPILFATEVGAWVGANAVGMGEIFSDPDLEALGAMVDLDRITLGLGAAVVVLTALVSLSGLARRAREFSVSLVQLPGLLALGAWWIGGPTVLAAAVVALSTLGAWWVSLARPARHPE